MPVILQRFVGTYSQLFPGPYSLSPSIPSRERGAHALSLTDSYPRTPVGFFVVLLAFLSFPRAAFLQVHFNPPARPTSPDALRLKEAGAHKSESSESGSNSQDPSASPGATAHETFGLLPLSFEVNEGQADSRAKFLAHGHGYSLFLTNSQAVFVLRKSLSHKSGGRQTPGTSSVLRMKLINSNPSPEVQGEDEQSGNSNYFIGSDPTRWRTNVKRYARVKYKEVYRGVGLIYTATSASLNMIS